MTRVAVRGSVLDVADHAGVSPSADAQLEPVSDPGRAAVRRAARLRALLDGCAAVDVERIGVRTDVAARLAHVHSLGHLVGAENSAERADAALASLRTMLADPDHGGWFAGRGPGDGVDGAKDAGTHTAVVLAAATAALADRPGARVMLDEALVVLGQRFWDPEASMLRTEWDRAWNAPGPYRGLAANMYGVEAMLAAYDATADLQWLESSGAVVDRVVGWASANRWRLPEHFTPDWIPDRDYNVHDPRDAERPYGSVPGHGFVWARLLLSLEAAHGSTGRRTDAAISLFERALADAWTGDGFVATVDWQGNALDTRTPVAARCAAITTAYQLARVTGDERYARRAEDWWPADPDPWCSGPQDVHVAVQALLAPDLPVGASFGGAVRQGLRATGPTATR